MLVLGLLLILGAALITVGAIFDAGETATVEILGQVLTTTAAGVFIAGLVTMLMFLIGVWAVSASFGRARRKRAERKAAKRQHRDSLARLEEERAALREENERLSHQLSTSAPGSATTGDAVADDARTAGAPDTSPATTAHDPDTDGRVIDHRSDLTAADGTSTSHARHRETL